MPDDDDWFGFSVAVAGDTSVVGAIEYESGSPYRSGSVYVYSRSGSLWSQSQKLNGSGGAEDLNFGVSVDLSGDSLAIGSNRSDHSGIEKAGAAYVFTDSGGVWTEQQRLTASDAAYYDGFGVADIDGDVMLIGAELADTDGVERSGAAYIFTRSGGVWTEHQKLVAEAPQDGARLGFKVALTSDVALVGGPFADVGSEVDAGLACSYQWAAFVFADGFEDGSAAAWSSSTGG